MVLSAGDKGPGIQAYPMLRSPRPVPWLSPQKSCLSGPHFTPPAPSSPCRFSPDLLGLQASSALAWLIVEVLAVLLSLYLVTVNTDLTTIDLVAFSGYKYVG